VDGSVIRLANGSGIVDDAESSSNITVQKDVTVLPGVQLIFTPEVKTGEVITSRATIERSSGSWLTAGFRAGQTSTISGAGANNGPYTIHSVTDSIITLADNSTVTSTTDTDGALFTIGFTISSNVSFTAQREHEDAKIINLSGNWSSDYRANQQVTITGADITGNNGSYTILSVAGNTMSITGALTLDMVDNGAQTTATVTASTVTDITWSVDSARIERSSGSWINDGFAANQNIVIKGSDSNDGDYVIDSVTATAIHLKSGFDLTFNDTNTNTVTTIQTPAAKVVQVANGEEVSFIKGVDGGNDKIELAVGSEWSEFGFATGQYIRVTGSVNGNNGLYKIALATGRTLVLATGYDSFNADETYTVSSEKNVIGIAPKSINQVVSLTAGTGLTLTVADNSITRATGDWAAEGFQANQYIILRGTSWGNDGTYRIQAITNEGKTLVLDGTYRLQDNETSAGIKIYAAPVKPGTISDLIYRTAGVDAPMVIKADLAEALRRDIERLEQDKKNYGGDAKALAGIDAQIDQLKYQAAELGLLGPDGSIVGNMEVTYIVAPYIEARGGDIIISGDTLSGSGKLDARATPASLSLITALLSAYKRRAYSARSWRQYHIQWRKDLQQ
jgi:hypothetical protein